MDFMGICIITHTFMHAGGLGAVTQQSLQIKRRQHQPHGSFTSNCCTKLVFMLLHVSATYCRETAFYVLTFHVLILT
jgi:hypothetical protein